MGWIFWLILVIVLAIIELATVNLLTIWFCISGLVALFLSFYIDNVAIVSTIFAVLGIFLLFTTRPILKEYLPTQKKVKKVEKLIGRIGIVTKDIRPDMEGEGKVRNRKYIAISDKKISKNTEIEVINTDGLKLVVAKKK